MVKKGGKPSLKPGVTLSDIESLEYITANELEFLEGVEEKFNCQKHINRGSVLNIAEMFAVKLYTDSTDCCYDLNKSLRTDKPDKKWWRDKWSVWNQCLMQGILKLHLAELALERKNPGKGWKPTNTLYSGLNRVKLNQTGIGFFKNYTSTTLERSVAGNFLDDQGMIMFIDHKMCQQFVNCDVSWISCHDKEYGSSFFSLVLT